MKYTWLVEKYLEGELSGEALRKFELEILRKPEVAEEVERVRSMHYFMQEQHSKLQDSIGLIEDFDDMENVVDEETIRQDLDGLLVKKISAGQKEVIDLNTKLTETKVSHTLVEQRSKKVLVRKVSVWLAAASVAILLGLSFSLIIGNSQADYMALYTQHYSAPEADETVRAASSELEYQDYRRAYGAYNEQNHEIAYHLFEDIAKQKVTDPKLYLYMGNAAMSLGNYQTALELFDHLETNASLNVEAEWYRGLCHLALENQDAARKVFEHIVSIEGHNYKQAKKILRKI